LLFLLTEAAITLLFETSELHRLSYQANMDLLAAAEPAQPSGQRLVLRDNRRTGDFFDVTYLENSMLGIGNLQLWEVVRQ
jgi:hypothetical protein